ncbi:hypothetical protein ACYFX5_08340 [Bremerella sp. T1]|uniref:hypothetical protein n=1 Tax=Bremerella sp. TYQ1 TaxID=3119568 RepID=UPI001CCEE521|nr:hypothetical protein [Bremerella volcania]UBM38266.1 hypothetical protein LA756_10275 [Bremerella volcania]
MDLSTRCVLYEPQPCWAPRLRGLIPTSSIGFIEVRVASEVVKLLSEDSQRLLMVALRGSMAAPQVAARLRHVANVREQWPACCVMLLLDEQMDAWQKACWEMGSGLVLVGTQSLPQISRAIDRFVSRLPEPDDPPVHADGPLDWLPW